MNTIKETMIITATGLALAGAGVAQAAKNENFDQAIDARQAIDIALASVPGHIRELELEREDGTMVWEVELVSSKDGMEYEIVINATTSEVIEIEMEDADDWNFFSSKEQN